MKKYNLFTLATLAIAYTVTLTSCLNDEVLPPVEVQEEPNSEQIETRGSLLKPGGTLTLAGTPIKFLTQQWWKYVLSLDCEGKAADDGSVLAASGKYGRVVFLGGINEGPVEKVVEITTNQILLVPVLNHIKEAPCEVIPSPDQILGKFLKDQAVKYINEATALKANLDGRPIKITGNNRVSSDLFSFTANTDLIACFDGCITGELQQGVSDGYWLGIQNLTRGKHILHVYGEIAHLGVLNDVTYYINVY